MKKVRNDVAHVWAHQLQDEARTPGSGNLYFRGDTIYSYGSHFPIAKHVENKKGEKAVLFTTRGYSNTTSKHLHIVRSASNHLKTIYVYRPDYTPDQNFEEAGKEMKAALSGLGNARKPEKYINPAESVLEQTKEYAKFFGLKVPRGLQLLIDNAKSGKYGAYLLKEAKRIKKEEEEKQARILQANIEGLKKWRQGKGGPNIGGRFEGVDYLRINRRKNRIETSQGIEIPMEIAKRAFRWIKLTLQAGGCQGECKYKILDFEVSEVNQEFVTIGCHKLLHPEIERIGVKMKW